MVISLNFGDLGLRYKAHELASCLIVRICKGHYIWCLASAQATTGSVPVCFVSLFGSGQINSCPSVAAAVFLFLKKSPGRLVFKAFQVADSGLMRLAKSFCF
jgi:hypothetical protein